MRYFNSIKVRLELSFPKRNEYGYVVFQFHKGAIRTVGPVVSAAGSILFQFHKGAIRTCQ